MAETGDEALLARARSGDEEAVAALVRGHQPRIYRFALKMCRRPEDAEDVLQDTLLAMARTVRGFRGASSVSTWLYTIARSFCIKKRRRGKFARPEVSLENDAAGEAREMPDLARGPDAILENRRLGQALDRALAALQPAHREVLLLRDVEGLPAAEVAQILGVSVQAVKSRLHRARAVVREGLSPLLATARDLPRAEPAACPDIVSLFSRHLEGEIGAEACAEMERHVAACPRCRSACDSLKETLRLCRAVTPPEVPAVLQDSIRQGIRELLAHPRA